MSSDKYQEWISQSIPSRAHALGQCAGVTLDMQADFPELIRVRGQYHCPIWGERDHWWLKDPDGNVIDPTAKQFPSGGIGEYQEWNEGDPEPTGQCPNCGNRCYNGASVCSRECASEYTRYLMSV